MEERLERVAQLARRAAQQMLKNGGEIYRVEEVVRHIGGAFGYETEVIAFTTGITMTMRDVKSGQSCSRIGRVSTRGVDLTRLARVNELSRALCEGRLDLAGAERELDEIEGIRDVSMGMSIVLAAGSAGFFSVMFGGGWLDFLAAGLCGALVKLACALLPMQSSGPMICILSGVLSAFLGRGAALLAGAADMDRIIVSTLMPFLPGLSFTNAIRDGMNGDLISGGARVGDALTQAVIMAGGVGVGLWVWAKLLGGGV